MRMLIAALAGAMSLAGPSVAAEYHLVAHGLSWHEGDRIESHTDHTGTRDTVVPWQSANYGLGVRRQAGAWAVQAGAYLNSYERASVYGLGEWTGLRAGRLHGGAFVGFASGYTHGAVAGGLVARWQGERFSVTLRGMPKVTDKQSGAVAALELGWRL